MSLGVMVGLRDFMSVRVPGTEFSELLLFEGDLDFVDRPMIEEIINLARPPVRFIHVQEFVSFGGRQELVDISSEDEALRSLSLEVVSRTRDLAIALGGLEVVIHPGGIRTGPGNRERLRENLSRSLMDLGPSMVLLENMPWYYWLRKTERMVSNLCVRLDDFEQMSNLVDGFVLDTCHGYLSRPEGDRDYCARFLERFGRKVRHAHVSDAKVPDTEGLQIGEGEIDFSFLKGVNIPTLVEIWRGHENDASGFRTGVAKLRALERNW